MWEETVPQHLLGMKMSSCCWRRACRPENFSLISPFLPPLSSSQEALVMVKTWSVPIKWKITPCYIPLMHPLHTEPFHQECWNTEREEAVELHLNRHHNQRPDWRPALYPTLALSVCMAHASPSGTSNRPSLLKAMSLFNTNVFIRSNPGWFSTLLFLKDWSRCTFKMSKSGAADYFPW